MSTRLHPEDPDLRVRFYRMYREFFDRAERKRRWSVAADIPWDQVNRNLPPEVADVVESFCAVELFLPDYIAKALPMIRANRGWSWFHANWGYEESKHSLALGDWLLRSGHRSEEQMADLEDLLSRLLPSHPDLLALRRGCKFLIQFAVNTRYPGYHATKRQASRPRGSRSSRQVSMRRSSARPRIYCIAK